jgi:high-affinity iron transporter
MKGRVGWAGISARRVVNTALTAVVVACVAAFGTAWAVGRDSADAHAITVSDRSCGGSWGATAGVTTFQVRNTGTSFAEVDLIGAQDPLLYGSLEMLAAQTERPLTLQLPPGQYQWRCELGSGATILSAAVSVRGPAMAAADASVPVTADELGAVATQFRTGTESGLATLATATDQLAAVVASGSRVAARRAWLVAHLDYERLGAAYGTFDTFDAKINGRPDGLPKGVNDPRFTGFLRLERALWGGEPWSTVQSVTTALDADVHGLVKAFPDQFFEIRDLPLRGHEILENALQFELTGQTDQGSHTNLATLRANVDGTRAVLDSIAPLLAARAPARLRTARAQLAAFATTLEGYDSPASGWTPVQSLTTVSREQLDGAMGQLVETLAPIPDLLELPRNSGQD